MEMNEENDWDHNVEGDAVKGPLVCASREEVLQALSEIKTGKAPGPSEVSLELVAVNMVWEFKRWLKYVRVLDRFGVAVELTLSIVVQIFKEKVDIGNCGCY